MITTREEHETPKQLPLLRSLAALTLCTLSTTASSNTSLDFKTPAAIERSGDKKYLAGDYAGAIDDYGQLIERYPDIPRGYTRRSVARGKLGLLKEALEDANKAVEIDPEHATFDFNRGIIKAIRNI